MSQRPPITVRLESFEGPLDLLLYLIQSHELDISRIAISKITDQFISYVQLMQELNFDTASEFLVMAATLLHWKSKAILPQEKDEAQASAQEEAALSPEQLLRQLLEHQQFLSAGQDLAQLPFLGQDVFARPNKRAPIERVWKTMNLTDLTVAYQDMLVKSRKRTTVLRKETVSISGKIVEFRDRLQVGKLSSLRSFLMDEGSRPETVVTFLASLELSRLRKMRLHQEVTYADIYLELIESLRNFNEDEASGFDNPDAPALLPNDVDPLQHASTSPTADFQYLHIPEDGAGSTLAVDLLRHELAAPNAAPQGV